MAGIIIALGVTNTLLTALNNPLLKEAFLSFAYGNSLKKLKGTVTTIKSVLLDAANKGELSEIDRDYINKLKEAVYDADDMFDELVTKAQRKQLFNDDNIFGKVRELFLSLKPSQKVRKLRSRLKDIADDHARFGLNIDTQPHRRLRVETFSYISAPTVVGRDDDAREVITMLLDSTKNVNFISIVGIGGVGKTTLAKLVFNEEWIKSEFNLRLWVCVSDQDGAPLDLNGILVKILDLLECKSDSNSSIESLHSKYQHKVEGKRLLLVLDDVWNESTVELNHLKSLLMIDGSESRIIATTRSMKMARIIGGGIHELQGLSDDNSRHLFEMVAFGSGSKPVNFIEIAEKIVEICSNVPLVIKVVGSLLYGQPIGIWQTFATSGFARFAKEENEIMSILKLSYDNLEPSLKSCFAYCAIFPKDYVISKEDLIELWEAQGYIVPFGEGQSIENAGEEHFSVLLQRCFFQDIERDRYGDVESFKIHDLMHDLAQRVSGKEICTISSNMETDLEYNVRHLFVRGSINYDMYIWEDKIQTFYHLLFGGSMNSDNSNFKSKIRSHLRFQPHWDVEVNLGHELLTFEIPNNWRCLRALALQTTNIRRLPDTIGDLLHLRYLNLSHSSIRKLPDSIVKLHNLQTLNMNDCKFLDQWPKEFSKLVNLTRLYIDSCPELNYMPVGMSKLSCIHTLTRFMVKDESASGTQCVGQLIDLKALALNLKGRIYIHIKENFKSAEGYNWEGSCLEGAKHLNEVMISFSFLNLTTEDKRKGGKEEEVVMDKLKPHPNLRMFYLNSYVGEKITRWGRARDNWATFLPNLMRIELMNCHYLQELPKLSKLRHLKYLLLLGLRSLEYMEEDVTSNSSSGSLDTTFFPSLEFLQVWGLLKLKGWWKPSDCNNSHCKLAFPNLSELHIRACPRLISFPPCLSNPKLDLTLVNKVLRITTADGVHACSPGEINS